MQMIAVESNHIEKKICKGDGNILPVLALDAETELASSMTRHRALLA